MVFYIEFDANQRTKINECNTGAMPKKIKAIDNCSMFCHLD